jgi:hypothetical protein
MKGWQCHWVLTSFGLAPDYKLALHEEIFTLCYYSNGAFGHGEAYGLPVHLRHFYIKKLLDAKKQESDQMNSSSKLQGGAGPKIDRPGIRK